MNSLLSKPSHDNLNSQQSKTIKDFFSVYSEIMRLKTMANEPKTIKSMPDNVPNYHLAIDGSPRVCGTCRFFQNDNSQCKAFKFKANADYVCDAWQGKALTSVHTTVRNDRYTEKSSTTIPEIPEYKLETTELDDLPVYTEKSSVTFAEIPEYKLETTELEDLPVYTENMIIRSINDKFLPGDTVYSKSLRTLAVIETVTNYKNFNIVGLKLIDNRGGAWGSAFTHTKDLIIKRNKATKQSTKTFELESLIAIIREVYEALETITKQHADFVKFPISNKDLLTPLQNHMIKIMQMPHWINVTTGPKRKYYRAMQHATHSIGGARQILFEGYKDVTFMKKNNVDMQIIKNRMYNAQKDSYERVQTAFEYIRDSLLLPSATHQQDAPGIKVVTTTIKNAMQELTQESFADNRNSNELLPDTILTVDVNSGLLTISEATEYIERSVKEIEKIKQTKLLHDDAELDINVDIHNTSLESKSDKYIASISFTLNVDSESK
jgi:hypothetical protein